MNDIRFVRTYNSQVLVGNWFEDIALKEEIQRDFLDKKEKGQLLIQRLGSALGTTDSNVCTSPCPGGKLKFGDKIQLLNPGADPIAVKVHRSIPRQPVVLSMTLDVNALQKPSDSTEFDVLSVTGSPNIKMLSKNIFEIVSVDDTEAGSPLLYGQHFALASCNENKFYLSADTIPIGDKKVKHRNHQVVMSPDLKFYSYWIAEYFNPQEREDNKDNPVEVNKLAIIRHAKTNQVLKLEKDNRTMTLFGSEFEISAKTVLDDHKAETDVNHWIFSTGQDTATSTESKEDVAPTTDNNEDRNEDNNEDKNEENNKNTKTVAFEEQIQE